MRYIGILLEFSENMRYIGIPDPQNEVYWYGIEIWTANMRYIGIFGQISKCRRSPPISQKVDPLEVMNDSKRVRTPFNRFNHNQVMVLHQLRWLGKYSTSTGTTVLDLPVHVIVLVVIKFYAAQ